METDFTLQTPEETMLEFSDKRVVLADGVSSYSNFCRQCGTQVIAINRLPEMFMLNICWGDGQIFLSMEICSNCVYELARKASNSEAENSDSEPTEGV